MLIAPDPTEVSEKVTVVFGPCDSPGEYAARWLRKRQPDHQIFASEETRMAFEEEIGYAVQMPSHVFDFVFLFASYCQKFGFEEYKVNIGDIHPNALPMKPLVSQTDHPKCNCHTQNQCNYCYFSIPAFLFR